MTVTALVGAQYGSEGKGAIAAKLADDYSVHIRTGAPNAGHTYYIDQMCDHRGVEWGEHYEGDRGHVTHHRCLRCNDTFPVIGDETLWSSRDYRHKVVARSIPCGVSNPNAHLVIGPGGLIDVDLLIKEVDELEALGLDPRSRLLVDVKCGIIDRVRHHEFEGGVDGEAHRQIGSTGEGVGPARMARIARGTWGHGVAWAKIEFAGSSKTRQRLEDARIRVHENTTRAVNAWIDMKQSILLEGTQGCGLSLIHGHWPYVTSCDTNAGQLCVDAGISPLVLDRVILVARSFPIRVAGASGPLANEISFADLDVEPEYTTVTKKMRRIGEWDDVLMNQAIMLNGRWPQVALTFADYISPEITGSEDFSEVTQAPGVREFLRHFRATHDANIDMIGTGPDTVAVR